MLKLRSLQSLRVGSALASLACLLCLAFPASAHLAEVAATQQAGVASADNNVERHTKDSQDWVPAQVGDVLNPGDHIRTGAGSAASLLLSDKTVMRLAEKSEVSIVDLTTDEHGNFVRHFQLAVGRVWSDVTPAPKGHTQTYEVKGPNAVAAVKGTAFEVAAGEGDAPTSVDVFDGSVKCTAATAGARPIVISPGGTANSFSASRMGQVFAVRRSRDQITSWQRWNMGERSRWKSWSKGFKGPFRINRAALRNFNKRDGYRPFNRFRSRLVKPAGHRMGPGSQLMSNPHSGTNRNPFLRGNRSLRSDSRRSRRGGNGFFGRSRARTGWAAHRRDSGRDAIRRRRHHW